MMHIEPGLPEAKTSNGQGVKVESNTKVDDMALTSLSPEVRCSHQNNPLPASALLWIYRKRGPGVPMSRSHPSSLD